MARTESSRSDPRRLGGHLVPQDWDWPEQGRTGAGTGVNYGPVSGAQRSCLDCRRLRRLAIGFRADPDAVLEAARESPRIIGVLIDTWAKTRPLRFDAGWICWANRVRESGKLLAVAGGLDLGRSLPSTALPPMWSRFVGQPVPMATAGRTSIRFESRSLAGAVAAACRLRLFDVLFPSLRSRVFGPG